LFILGLWLSGAFALFTVLTSVVAAALHRAELADSDNESLTFLRLVLTSFLV